MIASILEGDSRMYTSTLYFKRAFQLCWNWCRKISLLKVSYDNKATLRILLISTSLISYFSKNNKAQSTLSKKGGTKVSQAFFEIWCHHKQNFKWYIIYWPWYYRHMYKRFIWLLSYLDTDVKARKITLTYMYSLISFQVVPHIWPPRLMKPRTC